MSTQQPATLFADRLIEAAEGGDPHEEIADLKQIIWFFANLMSEQHLDVVVDRVEDDINEILLKGERCEDDK